MRSHSSSFGAGRSRFSTRITSSAEEPGVGRGHPLSSSVLPTSRRSSRRTSGGHWRTVSKTSRYSAGSGRFHRNVLPRLHWLPTGHHRTAPPVDAPAFEPVYQEGLSSARPRDAESGPSGRAAGGRRGAVPVGRGSRWRPSRGPGRAGDRDLELRIDADPDRRRRGRERAGRPPGSGRAAAGRPGRGRGPRGRGPARPGSGAMCPPGASRRRTMPMCPGGWRAGWGNATPEAHPRGWSPGLIDGERGAPRRWCARRRDGPGVIMRSPSRAASRADGGGRPGGPCRTRGKLGWTLTPGVARGWLESPGRGGPVPGQRTDPGACHGHRDRRSRGAG